MHNYRILNKNIFNEVQIMTHNITMSMSTYTAGVKRKSLPLNDKQVEQHR